MPVEWIKDAMRRAMCLVLLCALLFAPVAIVMTHGPDAVSSALQANAAKAAHGHAHDWDEAGKSGQHDATDHEHNIAFVLFERASAVFELTSAARADEPGFPSGLSRDGPRRPPRGSIV